MSNYDHGSFYDPGALPPDPSDSHADPYTGPPASGSGYPGPPGPPNYGAAAQPPWSRPTEPFPGSAYPPSTGSPYSPPPPYAVHHVAAPTNTPAVAAFVTGLLGLVLCWFPFLGLLLAVLGIALGAVGFAQSRQSGHGSGFAVAGLILGSVAIIPAFFILLAVA